MAKKETIVHWFRKGLRTHDNLALYVVRGNPGDIFPKLFEEWNVSLLTYEHDIEPYAVKRDKTVEEQAAKHKVAVHVEKSHTIFDPDVIVRRNGGKPPLTYQKYASLASGSKVPQPIGVPQKLPAIYADPAADSKERKDPSCYDTPTLEELGVDESVLAACKFPGGETEALRRMEERLAQREWICNFEKPNTSPNSLEPSTTTLSPYLKFGCLSARLFHNRLSETIKGRKHSQPPVSLIGQMMWREFYYCVAAATPNFDRMVGNGVCLQVDWDTNAEHLDAWTHGRTGYPFIDAIMRQLRQEGWIHHLARHAVACFLTRGDLWISWEEGQRVFEELLLDADWALNAGNWMWLSASAFFHQYFRVYSPVAFGKKTDPQGAFIKKYVPELARFPAGIIYEPWKANLATQKQLGCIIGKDYPARIVVHEEIHKVNIKRMSAAYSRNKALKEGMPPSEGNGVGGGDDAPKPSKTQSPKKRATSSSSSASSGKGKPAPKRQRLENTIKKFLSKK
uniref:Photolyase/cryptochrome alpha/beta domain-containing protein n=1 Tax=Anopheles atroparvus TaxID=41427 RepID=A0A182J8X8_ANOAO